jgi:Swiss Army Knife RNA repair-like protein
MRIRTLQALDPILESIYVENRRLVLESRDAKHLHVFDMDGTLARTPEPTDQNKDLYRYHSRSSTNPRGTKPGDWWGDHKTLRHPFETRPIEHTLKNYHAAKQDPNSRVVVMTGRVAKPDMQDAVSHTLHKLGVKGHTHGEDLFLKPPRDKKKKNVKTAEWKGHMLRQWHKEHPHLKHVTMWDDREEHLDHFRDVLHDLGVKHTLHHVKDPGWGSAGKMPITS